MKDATPIAVTSRSFSRHPGLRAELLERYERVTFNDEGRSLAGDELVDFLRGSAKAITALERIDEAVLSRLPELEVISKVGVGLDMLDLGALRRHGVRLAWTCGTNSRSVAELVVALAIVLLRGIVPAANELRAGGWQQQEGACLSGRTVGIAGLGNVGRDVAALVAAFGCPVLAYDLLDDASVYAAHGATRVALDRLLQESHVVSLHLELNEQTRGIIDASRLALMRPDAILINTARGGLVDEDALADALRGGRLAGAALDVFAVEPPGDNALLTLPNVIATPHIGGSTGEAVLAMGRAAIAGLESAVPVDDLPGSVAP